MTELKTMMSASGSAEDGAFVSYSEVLPFDAYALMSDEEASDRIKQVKRKLSDEVVLLCHHYQRADVFQHADVTGDSLKLSRRAAELSAKYIVFCGVHFMAEVADVLSRPDQVAILPDLAAGCSMADMANRMKVESCWSELKTVLDPDEVVTPVTYINSAATLKAFCGEHGGVVCTSSNAQKVLRFAWTQREKVLFFPDQHLGRYSGYLEGLSLEEMSVWNPNLPRGGLTKEQIQKAKIILWYGYCSVHQMFQKSQIDRFREQYPQGKVISHPECSFEVCQASDYVGSTEKILTTVHEEPHERWLVGTELNLVERLAKEVAPQGKKVQFMADMVCMCSTMQRIDPQHLLWCLENLFNGQVVNQVKVSESIAESVKLSLSRMLEIS